MHKLLAELSQSGIRLALDGDRIRVNAPEGAMTPAVRDLLAGHRDDIVAMLRRAAESPASPPLRPDADARFEPFPLTDIQHAYWLGRDNAWEMGNVATHLYVELDCPELRTESLNEALNRLIQRHDMLRAVVSREGMQRILPSVDSYRIAVDDQSLAAEPIAESAALATRDALSHQVLAVDSWPLFDIRATKMPNSRTRLHVSLDLLIFDAGSIVRFFQEWFEAYAEPGWNQSALTLSFRDYVVAERKSRDSQKYRAAEKYWMSRIDALPPAPQLPLRNDLALRTAARFTRRELRLERQRWDAIKQHGRASGLSPSAILLAAYSEILARWSSNPRFTVNVTRSDRSASHPEAGLLLGNFTTLTLLEVDRSDCERSFVHFGGAIQQQLRADSNHGEFSGVAVLREWSKAHGTVLGASMPVVFSSGLSSDGDLDASAFEMFGKKVFSISQTSQVWLDNHVMEVDGDLVCVWDAADAVFEDGVLDAMFAAYTALVRDLATGADAWSRTDIVSLAPESLERREAPGAGVSESATTLHDPFVAFAKGHSDAIAIIAEERTMSYGEVLRESAALANRLLDSGVTQGDLVAVLSRKGWEQVVATIGILLAGCAYMPVDADLPVARQLELLAIGEVEHIVTQQGVPAPLVLTGEWSIHELTPGAGAPLDSRHHVTRDSSDLAYVIFTSGTTGVPKGVMIEHGAVSNTIASVSRLCNTGPDDRVLALSSLSFDLSVYDIFGILGAGGALVIPDPHRGNDATYWLDLVATNAVTVWNSAPQLMRMFLDMSESAESLSLPLTRVLLSGDFIPLDVPARLEALVPGVTVISLGGATEASIWSIFHTIEKVDSAWSSIPYGRALPGQTVRVLDHALRPSPDQVEGRIYIGGRGLARGYWRDQPKTEARFIRDPRTGDRLYDTGDEGKYLPDGSIVILGRSDRQKKIRGHRVELGEVEAVLNEHPMVKHAAVVAPQQENGSTLLVAFVETVGPVDDIESALKAHSEERLPEYMVPSRVVLVDAIPVSTNGKRDFASLELEALGEKPRDVASTAPRNVVESSIAAVWQGVMPGAIIGVTDNFFDLGGDSVMATELVRELNVTLPLFNLEMHEIFENITVEALAALYLRRQEQQYAPEVVGKPDVDRLMVRADSEKTVMLSDVAALAEAAENLVARSNRAVATTPPEHVFVTGATGWVGIHVVAELLAQTSALVTCLVRAKDTGAARERLFAALSSHRIELQAGWEHRLRVVAGDLDEPRLGLNSVGWVELAESVDSIYHLGASLNVMADYASLRKTNVQSSLAILQLATESRMKPVFLITPMTVGRRYVNGRFVMLPEEQRNDADGLMTGYAQSKWAVEQVFLAAADRGLRVKIYRTSHALPTHGTALAKQADTCTNILRVASQVGSIPDWPSSRINGTPTDILCSILVTNSLEDDPHTGIIHIDNRDPLDVSSIMEILVGGRSKNGLIPLEKWLVACRKWAAGSSRTLGNLANLVFAHRADDTSVERIFHAHPIDTSYFLRRGQESQLSNLTPPSYWRKVAPELSRREQ